MDLGLTEHVYVVTGGGRGLGRATADLLVAEGARVVLSGRTRTTARRAVAELGDAPWRSSATTPTRDRVTAWCRRPATRGVGSTGR